jgi:putative ABC transport system permease protein
MVRNDGRGARWLEDILQDARYTFRGMARNKAFFALILFVLAVGSGVNTAILSIVDAKIIKPLPFHHPSELVVVWDTYLPQFSKLGISPAEFQAWQSQRSLFQATAWYRHVSQDVNLAIPGSEPIAAHADIVSPDLFPLLGVSPLLAGCLPLPKILRRH